MQLDLSYSKPEDYQLFLKIKELPVYRFVGRTAYIPDEYAARLGLGVEYKPTTSYVPKDFLFDYQRDISALAIRKERFAAFVSPGYGKGLLPECPVLTPKGFTPLSAIKVGDFVIGGDGNPTQVVGVFERGMQPVYRVTFSDKTNVVCDGDHLWNVMSSYDYLHSKKWRTLSVAELMKTNIKMGVKWPKRNWRIPLTRPVNHEKKILPIDPYVLGVLLGDGSMAASVQWCKDDEYIADRMKRSVADDIVVTKLQSKNRAQTWSLKSRKLGGTPNSLQGHLRGMGLAMKRSWEKFVPEEYLYSSADDRIALLQGLMDTDGYVGKDGHGIEFCSTSERLAKAVQQLVESLGGTAMIGFKDKPKYTYLGELKYGRKAFRVTMTLPEGINPFYSHKKASKYKTPSRGLGRFIESIEPCGEAKTICIKVAADDGLFVIDRYIVTHNTLIGAEFVRHALANMPKNKSLLWLSPLMVVKQTTNELRKFYGDNHTPDIIKSSDVAHWLKGNGRFGITNFEALQNDFDTSRIGGIVIDESSVMKDSSGVYGTRLIAIGKGIRWKLCLTGTPAPNDRIEYANHAVFLDRCPNVNAFYAKYFVNKGMTGERWELKPHAIMPFYRDLSDWCIFLSNPAVYGWKDNIDTIPPTHVHIEDVPLTNEQAEAVMQETNSLFPEAKGIASRSRLARIAKGFGVDGQKVDTNKPLFIKNLVESWPDESTIIWCKYNAEQEQMEDLFPGCASISGSTPEDEREELVADFQQGRRKVLISKARILGLGLNLQVCTRMIFSTCQDSWEEFYQAVKRANRVGSTRPLNVYLPVTDVERPMMENVLQKAHRIEEDTKQQELMFRQQGYIFN